MLWDNVWAELRDSLSRQPHCAEHPEFPFVRTLAQGAINDILLIGPDGIQVRSHRTGNEDFISVDNFRAWWEHLQQHGTAALSPMHANNPVSDRAVLVGAILASCLPNWIVQEGNHIKLVPAPQFQNWPLPEELPVDMQLVEGAARTVVVNAYERDPEARQLCVAHYGTSCSVCGMNFGAVYGPIAEGYIHVHHLRPLSEIGGEYVVDPIKDLRPVCPNCHAVLHRRIPVFSIEELRGMMKKHSFNEGPASNSGTFD